jgi:hypothetical protein
LLRAEIGTYAAALPGKLLSWVVYCLPLDEHIWLLEKILDDVYQIAGRVKAPEFPSTVTTVVTADNDEVCIHTQEDLDQAAYSVNTRPRQTLSGMTPSDKLAEAMP